ncbi:alpha/beta hydrolase [Paenibacillus sp. LHD-38]|uniref:alpha/beta fold hydrolase n=1 Tax=Paenibacillus sp. LHD-38 TaxID=3072143 RepID=UPI00280E25F3|nr:alpha/beta hydrolase [Paenibacillus sp. LHD-38]MDQ8738360.1 alpha/beta hydrolase [Paenibacillus sp. LHD-38]
MGIFNLFYQFDRCTSNPNAEVVVLIHGLGLNAHTWEPLVLLLVERYHVLRYDMRGHGKSLNDGSELTWELLCNDLDDLYHECDIEKAHMIGHGLGGSLTVKYELTRPDRVETVVLISTVGFYPPGLVKRSLSLRQGYAGNGGAAELGEQMTRLVTCLSLDSEEAGWIKEAYRQCDMKVYFHLASLFATASPLDDLSAITKPCMVIGGEKDTLYPSYMSEITAAFIPNARSVTVLNAASMVYIDNPIYTARKIMDFYANPLSGRETVHAGNPQLGIMNSDIVELFSQVNAEIPSKAAQRIEVRLIGLRHYGLDAAA